MVEGTPEPEAIEVVSRPDYKWYILQTYSGYENRVRRTLEEKLRIEHLEELVEEIFVPGEDVTRVKGGRKRKIHVVYFPGYVLIKMKLTDELWHLLMNIPRVSGFVGGTNRDPQPLEDEELGRIHAQMDEGISQATLGKEFEIGQQVVVIDGPFANFGGMIDEVNSEKRKVRVLISIIGRSTPVELDFDKIKAQND
ncbi:MAG: transcription termination/antitermination protein NusG [SAR324 cluster bacterium]|nr:transcription termination/antitermination protein NusG [SAR324 cluster bacterium]